MGRKTIRIIYALALIATIWAHPSHADPLQDRIETAIKSFSEIIPHAPDVALGWSSMVIDNAIKQANPSATVQTTSIGSWLTSNQPKDVDPLLMQRAEWLASAFKAVMGVNTVYPTALPAQTISVAELKLRIDTAIDKVTPGPTKEEIQAQSEAAGRSYAEAMRAREARRIAAEYKRQWE